METAARTSSLKDFLTTYESGLKATAPVKTGRLRDSILVFPATLAAIFEINVDAVYYGIYANRKHHFVERNDFRIEDFATNFAEAFWEDFAKDNKEPKN